MRPPGVVERRLVEAVLLKCKLVGANVCDLYAACAGRMGTRAGERATRRGFPFA